MKQLEGTCLCGKVKIQIPDDFDYMGNCHCSECRKFSGSDYASVGGIDSSKFKFIAGEESVTYYHKTRETDLAFCSSCGSSLFTKKVLTNKHNIRLGILNDAPTHKPSFHIFTDSKAPWLKIADDLPQFPEKPVKR